MYIYIYIYTYYYTDLFPSLSIEYNPSIYITYICTYIHNIYILHLYIYTLTTIE